MACAAKYGEAAWRREMSKMAKAKKTGVMKEKWHQRHGVNNDENNETA